MGFANVIRRPLFSVTVGGLLVFLGILLCAGSLLYLLRDDVMVEIAEVLVVEHPLLPTDTILALGGDVTSVVDFVARIYPDIRPRWVLVSPTKVARESKARLMKRHGLSPPTVRVLPSTRPATSTYEEARDFSAFARMEGIRSVTIVTSAVHTSRAHWIFRRLVDPEVEIRMAAAPPVNYSLRSWWSNESGLLAIQNEIVKWAFYWWNY